MIIITQLSMLQWIYRIPCHFSLERFCMISKQQIKRNKLQNISTIDTFPTWSGICTAGKEIGFGKQKTHIPYLILSHSRVSPELITISYPQRSVLVGESIPVYLCAQHYCVHDKCIKVKIMAISEVSIVATLCMRDHRANIYLPNSLLNWYKCQQIEDMLCFNGPLPNCQVRILQGSLPHILQHSTKYSCSCF